MSASVVDVRWVCSERVDHQARSEEHRGERLSDLVMQVPSDARPLGLLGSDHPSEEVAIGPGPLSGCSEFRHGGGTLPLGRHQQCGIDRSRSERGEHHDPTFVVGVEGSSIELLGEVQVAEPAIAQPDRNTEERVHHRMARREPAGSRIGGEVFEPDRSVGNDDLAEEPAALGKRPDRPHRVAIEAVVCESFDAPIAVVHTEGGVPCVGDLRRVRDHAFENVIEVVVGGQVESSAQKRVVPRSRFTGSDVLIGRCRRHPVAAA